jgi:hypothetical protein
MDRTSTKQTEADLEVITRQLHDLWFDVSEVRFDRAHGTVTIPFLSHHQPRASAAFRDRWLCIGRVEHLQLEESEGIGRYDFNKFRFAPETGVLRLSTGVPLTLEINVAELDVSVRSFPGDSSR